MGRLGRVLNTHSIFAGRKQMYHQIRQFKSLLFQYIYCATCYSSNSPTFSEKLFVVMAQSDLSECLSTMNHGSLHKNRFLKHLTWLGNWQGCRGVGKYREVGTAGPQELLVIC